MKSSADGEKRTPRRRKPHPPTPFTAPFLHAVGGDLLAKVEEHPMPERVDHVWISMRAGGAQRVLVSVNTFSKRSYDAGFDPRVRVGQIRETWKFLPPRGIEVCDGFDYAVIEGRHNVFYEHFERPALEHLLTSFAARAEVMEVWGTPYHHRVRPGLHQIHSRRASCAVPEDIRNRDGALRFYFAADRSSVLVLFKFCGQE